MPKALGIYPTLLRTVSPHATWHLMGIVQIKIVLDSTIILTLHSEVMVKVTLIVESLIFMRREPIARAQRSWSRSSLIKEAGLPIQRLKLRYMMDSNQLSSSTPVNCLIAFPSDPLIRSAVPSDLSYLSSIEHPADSLFFDVPEYSHLITRPSNHALYATIVALRS